MEQLKEKIDKEKFMAKFNVLFSALFLAILFIIFPSILNMGWLYITLWSVTLATTIYILFSRIEVYKALKG